jgi:hypothetical protein
MLLCSALPQPGGLDLGQHAIQRRPVQQTGLRITGIQWLPGLARADRAHGATAVVLLATAALLFT